LRNYLNLCAPVGLLEWLGMRRAGRPDRGDWESSMSTQAATVPLPDAAPPPVGSRIDLDDVGRRYRVGEVEVVALREVNLHVDEGAFVVVLGPSGSGKTTLLNLIGALDTPTEGRIRLAGADITSASRAARSRARRETVSFIFQSFNLFPALTALENVRFGADVVRRPRARELAADLLGQVGLGGRLNHFPHQLSGGEQQRVAIARALATGNPILLADEPTGELDFETGVQILRLLQDQAREGRTVLVVTHNREISRVADRVVELSSGRIVRDGPPAGGRADVGDLHW
jgi:putative ABC transport system ATP-binding protein